MWAVWDSPNVSLSAVGPLRNVLVSGLVAPSRLVQAELVALRVLHDDEAGAGRRVWLAPPEADRTKADEPGALDFERGF